MTSPSSETSARGGAVERTPAVTVVIPAYNAADFISESINSVLKQTWTDLELIVVEDGSTDATRAIVRRFDDPRMRVIEKANGGTVSDARNAGFRAATAPLVALLDADDVWLPEKLATQLPLFDQPDVVLVYCAYAITDEHLLPKTVIRLDPRDDIMRRWLLVEGNGVAPSTSIFRRNAAFRAGLYNLELSVSEDLEFAERVARQGRIDSVDDCLTLYRTHVRQGHRDLIRFRHDVEWILADRFGPDGSRDRPSWARGTANLATRLAAYEMRHGRYSSGARHLVRALRLGPARVVGLPAAALIRRVRRRLDMRRNPFTGVPPTR